MYIYYVKANILILAFWNKNSRFGYVSIIVLKRKRLYSLVICIIVMHPLSSICGDQVTNACHVKLYPQHVSHSCIVGAKAVLKSYYTDSYVGFDNTVYRRGLTGDKQMQFELIRPGLTKGANTVSLMSAKTPGWYVRSYVKFYPQLELRANSPNQQDFDIDATFIEHTNTFYRGTVAFESVSILGYYLCAAYHVYGGLYFRKIEDSVAFKKGSSFVVLSPHNSRKRRTADNGKKIHCLLCLETHSIIYFYALSSH